MGRGTAKVNGLVSGYIRVVGKKGGGGVREKGGRGDVGRAGSNGGGFFHHKSPTVCQGQCRTVRSHPLISALLSIKPQPHSVRLALEGQIRLPSHTSSKSTLPQLRCV